MTGLFRDCTTAARTLLKARAFTAVCVISLGLGMGVVIAILLLMRMVFSDAARRRTRTAWPSSSSARAGSCWRTGGQRDHRHLVVPRLSRRP